MRLKEKKKIQEIRCMHCNRMLGKLRGVAEIKCPKCGTMNHFDNKQRVLEPRDLEALEAHPDTVRVFKEAG